MNALFSDLPKQAAPHHPRRRRPTKASMDEPWPLEGKINVVLFAGMGGACQGMEEAGFPVHVAVNHDEIAIAAHKALNPHTHHLQADIYEVDPLLACRGRYVGNLWGSPDCRDHSVAKGGAPRSPRVRSMPWQLCRWTGVLRKRGLGPDAVYLENVREIRGWGPLIAKRDKATGRVIKLDGTVAAKGERVPVQEQQLVRDPRRVGRHYRAWVKHMRSFGAIYEDRDMCCADYGVPTSRKRLFGVALFDGRQPSWPEITHGHRTSEAVAAGALLPHVPAASFIDWSLPLPSIFDRKKSLAPATMKRIAVGMKRFVLEAEKPFLIHLTHQGASPAMDTEHAGNTFTGAHRGEVALVSPCVAGVNNVSTRACRVFPTDDPLTTQCTVQGNALVGASIAPMFISPNHTASYYDFFRGHRADDPGYTMTQNMGHALVGAALVPTIIGAGGRAAQMPPIDIAGALNTSTTKEDRCVMAAHLVQTGYGERVGQAPRCLDIENSIGTQVAGGGKHAVCGTWMVQHNTGVVGHVPDESLSTMTVAGTQQQVAGAYLIHQRGTGVASSPEDSARTLTTGGGKGGDHIGTCVGYLTEYYGTGGQHCAAEDAINTLSTLDRFAVTGGHVDHLPLSPDQIARARQVAEFLRAHGVWSGGDIVTFGAWIVVDIGMRMLRPEEAAAAHELTMPDLIRVKQRDRKGNVVLDAKSREVWNERPLTKTEAMRLVGNSVPKRMARLLLEYNARASLAMEAAE